jgi:hypothetical protein
VTSSSETLVLTRATWHHIPEDGILHSHCHENLNFYKLFLNLTFSNRTHQLLFLADDVDLLEDNIDTTNKNPETSVDTSNEEQTERKLSMCCCLVTRMQGKIIA